ncbi:MAG: permease-like cell division protein FtsX [Clostridia bacterium]|nr:permease-like cell division protein FtsX [Clostridia bacterium]
MKYSRLGYFIGEGFGNVFKNKKSTMASLMIMCATMIVFGIFLILGENINYIVKEVEKAQGIQVFINSDATEEQIKELGEKIKNLKVGDKYAVNTVVRKGKEEALDSMKERLKDKQYLLEGFSGENNIFPESYVVTLTDLNFSKEVQDEIVKMDNVKKITSKDQTIEKLIKIASGIKIATFVILLLLILISIFIIANTIKLTVHARRKEISIMKYVGATNNFIRWPFIVEGIVIGIFASAISILIIALAYDLISGTELIQGITKLINMDLLKFNEMFNYILLTYMGLGIGIGTVGSIISMRKYLKV